MSYTPKQWRAINHYLKKNGLRPELSAYPVVRFTNMATKESGQEHIAVIESTYVADKEKAKREQAQSKRAEKRREKRPA